MGHSMSDPVSGVYRTKEEVEEAKKKDPIRILIDQLKEGGMITDAEVQAIDERVHQEVNDAAEFAERSPDPSPDDLYRDVYAQINEHGRLFFDRQDRMED